MTIKHLAPAPGTYVKDKSSWVALNLSPAGATNNESLYRGRSAKAVGPGTYRGDIMQSRPLAAASAALVCGSIASASGVVVQIAGQGGDGKSLIASVPLSLSTTLATIVSPIVAPPSPAMSATTPSTAASSPSPAMRAPDNRQGSASPSNSPYPAPLKAATPPANSPHPAPLNAATPAANPPHPAPLDAAPPAVTASTEAATTDLAQEPVPAAKKSQKAGRSPNERNRSAHDAAAWGRYAHERQTSSW